MGAHSPRVLGATGDEAALLYYQPWIEKRLVYSRDVLYPQATKFGASLRWSRDDPRMGFGFEFSDIPRAQYAFRALSIDAMSGYADAIRTVGNASCADQWTANAQAFDVFY